MPAGNTYSPVDPVALADPYPYYTALRAGPAATYLEEDDLWVVPRFEHVREIARTPESYSSKALRAVGVGAISARTGPRPDVRALDARAPKSLIAADPPDHTRLRRLVSKPFTPRMVATLAEQTRAICEDAVDDLLAAARRGDADLVRDFNFPVPVLVIASFLGIPGERRDDFKRWSNALVGRLEGQPLSEDQFADLAEMSQYFEEVVAQRIQRPGSDLISWIIAGSDDGEDPLTADDLVAFCTLLLVAGNETTTNLLGNLFLAFWDHPDQYDKMRAAQDLRPVIEEALRYDSPVQGILRLTNTDLALGEVQIPEDNLVLILFGSANRDETRWPDGHRFDIEREPLDHLGFGTGIHMCLGAHLARLEATIALDVLRSRVRTIEPRAEPERLLSPILRGMTSMPIDLEPT